MVSNFSKWKRGRETIAAIVMNRELFPTFSPSGVTDLTNTDSLFISCSRHYREVSETTQKSSPSGSLQSRRQLWFTTVKELTDAFLDYLDGICTIQSKSTSNRNQFCVTTQANVQLQWLCPLKNIIEKLALHAKEEARVFHHSFSVGLKQSQIPNYAVKSSWDEQLFALEVREHHRLRERGVNNQTVCFSHHP